MGKTARKRAKRDNRARAAPLHPVIAQADIPAAQRARFVHEVAAVPNPYGEFVQDGVLRRHKACRRVPHFETLYRAKVIDRHVFVVLEWYDARLARAESGLIRCGLDTSGAGGGTVGTHIPLNLAAMEARADIGWARGFISVDLLPAFDGVMTAGETFEAVGARVYAHLSRDRAKRKASSAFQIAANQLLLGIGHRIGVPTVSSPSP